MDFKSISVENIILRPDNPRLTFFDESMNELARSLKRDGFIQPIVVRPKGLKYELVVGERRVRAAINANIPKLPAIIREEMTDEEASRIRLAENINRKDLNVFERVEGINAHLKKFGLTIEEMADQLDKTPETLKSWFHLAETTSPKIKIADTFVRKLGTQKLMEISKYNFETQELLAEKILKHDLKVDQVRRFIILFESNPEVDLDTLADKVKEQVKTIEVTLPIDEAREIEKRAKKFREKAKKARKKLQKHLRKKRRKEKEKKAEEEIQMTNIEVTYEEPDIKRLWDTALAKVAGGAGLSTDQIDLLRRYEREIEINQLRLEEIDANAKALVQRVLDETRPQVMVLEVPPKLYGAVEAYAGHERVFLKDAVLMLVEEGLEAHGYWIRGR